MPNNANLIAETFRSRVSRRVVLAVFVIVLAVEAAFLWNAARTERAGAIRDLVDEAQAATSALFLTHPYPMTDKLLLATTELLLPGSPIAGGTYLRRDGSAMGSFGLAPPIGEGISAKDGRISEDGRYVDMFWHASQTGAPYAIAVRLDLSGVNIASDAFTERAVLIAVLLTLIIGGALAFALSSTVLMPLARLRRSLGLAPGVSDSIEAEWRELLDAALRRGRAPRLENPDVERRVEERTAELRAEIDKRKETESKLARLAQMTNDATGPILRIAADGKVLYANEQARRMLTIWGTVPGGALPDRWRDRFASFLQRKRPGTIEEAIEDRWYQLTCVPYPDQSLVNVYGFDVTDRPRSGVDEQPSKKQAALNQMQMGLAVAGGRPALEERLAQGIANTGAGGGGALLFVEIDDFTEIAKSVGHDSAVRFLGEIASRLRTVMGPAAPVIRLERCLFGLVDDADDCTGRTEVAAKRAERLVTALSAPYTVNDQTIQTQANIGITMFPADSGNVPQLIRNAEMALDHAREEGPNTFRFFMAATNEVVDQRHARLTQLKHNVGNGDLILHYQARLDLKSCRIRTAEALLRWPEPGVGLTLPGDFLTLASDGDLMEAISKWTIHNVCKTAKAWQLAGLPFIRVAVNVPRELVASGELDSVVDEILLRSELDAEYLEIDVAEAVAAAHLDETSRAFGALRTRGVTTGIDRFGAGGVALRDLCRLAPQRLKLDPAYVAAIGTDPAAGQTVRAAAQLAHGMDAALTAIGAENAEQVEFLRTLGIGELQGVAFAEPMRESAFREFLDNFTEATLSFPGNDEQRAAGFF